MTRAETGTETEAAGGLLVTETRGKDPETGGGGEWKPQREAVRADGCGRHNEQLRRSISAAVVMEA